MTKSLNIPIPAEAFRRPRLVFKNRSARRSRVGGAKADLTLVASGALPEESSAETLPPLPCSEPAAAANDGGPVSLRTGAEQAALSQAVLLDWLGSQPVAFQRVYVDVCGGVIAAVWLSMALSLLDGKGREQVDAQGVFRFTMPSKLCEAQTGLTDAEQRRARQQLINAQLLYVQGRKGGRNTPVFALDLHRLTAHLLQHSEGLAQLLEQQQMANQPKADPETLERRARARSAHSA